MDRDGNLEWPEGLTPRNQFERELKDKIEDDDNFVPIGVCNQDLQGGDGGVFQTLVVT